MSGGERNDHANSRTDRISVLEGNVQNVMNGLLGLTVQCARCHDHKFEPISQEEYYGLQALLFPVYNPERWSKPSTYSGPGSRASPSGSCVEGS